ncbi:MAG: helix-turn-helix domain-containing protein [Frankiaceae bacterium]
MATPTKSQPGNEPKIGKKLWTVVNVENKIGTKKGRNDMASTHDQPERTLGYRVRELRQGMGLSLRGLASRSGADASWLLRLERDEYRAPDPRLLWQVAQALGIEVEELYQAAGYSDGLPGLAPYLRAKYQLPEAAIAQLEAHFQLINDKYQRERGNQDEEDDYDAA